MITNYDDHVYNSEHKKTSWHGGFVNANPMVIKNHAQRPNLRFVTELEKIAKSFARTISILGGKKFQVESVKPPQSFNLLNWKSSR